MSWKIIAACVLCLVLGYGLRSIQGGAKEEKTVNESRSEGSTSSRVSVVNAEGGGDDYRSGRRVAHGGKKEGGATFAELGSDDTMISLPMSMLEKMTIKEYARSISDDLFSKDDVIVEKLQISEAEKDALQEAWDKTREKVAEMESSAADVNTLPDGSVKITLSADAIDPSNLGQEMYSKARDILGSNRGDVFAAVKQFSSVFTKPEKDQTYTVKMEQAGNGKWRYQIYHDGEGDSQMWIGDSIPEKIQHITDVANIVRSLKKKGAGAENDEGDEGEEN